MHTIAAFGAEIADPILGYVIPLSSFTAPCGSNDTTDSDSPSNSGCPKLCLTDTRQPTETWIALVQRGGCEFVKKVREVQGFGAKAVVVGGEDPEVSGYPDTLVNMYSPGSYLQRFWSSFQPSHLLHKRMPLTSILPRPTSSFRTICNSTHSYQVRIPHILGCKHLVF